MALTVFRTTGYNSIRTLAARLRYYQAVSGNRLAFMPLEMRLRGKSTTQSHRMPIHYVDLTVRDGQSVQGAIQEATEGEQAAQQAGYDQAALDEAGRRGFQNAEFENLEDETSAVIEEFYGQADTDANQQASAEIAQPEFESQCNRVKQRLATK